MPGSASRSALTALGAVGAIGAGAAIWGIEIERYLFAVLIHQCSCLSGANLGDGTHPRRMSQAALRTAVFAWWAG